MRNASMRSFILASAMLASTGAVTLFTSTVAQSSPAPTFSQPATEAYMNQLDTDQLRIVRRAVQGCPSTGLGGGRSIRPERNPCVISSTDRAVADSGNPDLETFHQALPASDRYDEHRSTNAWRVWLTKS
jgi:hypothetical protein